MSTVLAAPASAQGPVQIDSHPRPGSDRVSPDAELSFVFDRPTTKSGAFSVADLDSASGLIPLGFPRWSALGDTVFLKPAISMPYGHRIGMRVNAIFAAADSAASIDLPVVEFRIVRPAMLVLRGGSIAASELHLVPDLATPLKFVLEERGNTAASITDVREEFLARDAMGLPGALLHATRKSLSYYVPRRGVVTLPLSVLLPGSIAETLGGASFHVRLTLEGRDEIGLPFAIEVLSIAASATSIVGGDLLVRDAFLEWPLPGAVIAAGDTLEPRAVVTGVGTGPFRATFYVDGDIVALEEGFMESGRPALVEPRGPILTRQFGEHRLQFVVESPQNVAAQPVTFLCVPPANGVTPKVSARPADPVTTEEPRLTFDQAWLAQSSTSFGAREGATVAWWGARARQRIGPDADLEGRGLFRLRVDESRNGSVAPEQAMVRFARKGLTLEWGDAAPTLSAPLLASPVPRRAARGAWRSPGFGSIEGLIALGSRPRSAAGASREVQSDLYAAQLTRGIRHDAAAVSIFGGYAREKSPSGGTDPTSRTSLTYGGAFRARFAQNWQGRADVATVNHRRVEGLEPGRTRTAWTLDIRGTQGGFEAKAEAFRHQPGMETALHPYALSNRIGAGAEIARSAGIWRFFAGYRREEPEESRGADARAERLTLGGRLSLNQVSWVTPSLVRMRQKGTTTDFIQTRVATEFSAAEPLGGRTTARFDIARFEDRLVAESERLVIAGSVVSTRRHPGRVASTLSAGVERNELEGLDLLDQTVQGAFGFQWEASPGRLLVAPEIAYIDRNMESVFLDEDRLTGRLQVSLLRVPSIGEAAISIEGRVERLKRDKPARARDTDFGVSLVIGERLDPTRHP